MGEKEKEHENEKEDPVRVTIRIRQEAKDFLDSLTSDERRSQGSIVEEMIRERHAKKDKK